MLIWTTLALANTCNTAADRADTSCWFDTWTTDGRASLTIGLQGGTKWVSVKLDGETVKEGKLEGARSKRTAAIEGCGATFDMQNDGTLSVTLDGPECPVEAATTYRRRGTRVLPVDSHCGRKTLFVCETTGKQTLSVCQDEGLDASGKNVQLATLVMGAIGTGEQMSNGVMKHAPGDVSWTFGDGETKTLAVKGGAHPSAELVLMDSGTFLGTVTCQPGWFLDKGLQ